MRKLCAAAVLAVVTVSMGASRAYPGCDPTDPPPVGATQSIRGFEDVSGQYVLPDTPRPQALVVMFHGYGNDSDSWVCHMLDAAAHGAVAFALDYRGTGWIGEPDANRGWFVKEGAEDSIALASAFLRRFPSIRTVVSFGISMGGNASGLAVSRMATRPGGAPLFDYWIDVEGVVTLAEEYVLASAVGLVNEFAQRAADDMNEECRRNYSDLAACLADLTVLAHAGDIAAGGLRGAVVVHGLDDGLVPADQSRQISTALRAAGVPVEQYTALRRNDWQNAATAEDEGGTTLSQNVAAPLLEAAGQPYSRPLAGHGWEGSDTHIVIKTAFNRLWRILDGGRAPRNAEFAVDGDAGRIRLV
ncbi:MAG: alpha/beta hydrolase family protein [Actinomycetota bacterium]